MFMYSAYPCELVFVCFVQLKSLGFLTNILDKIGGIMTTMTWSTLGRGESILSFFVSFDVRRIPWL